MLKDLIITGTGSLINGIGGFIFLIAAAGSLPIEEYGRFALIVSLFLFFAKLTEIGTTSSFVHLSIKDSMNYNRSLLLLKGALLVLMAVLLSVTLSLMIGIDWKLLALVVLGLIGYALNDYLFALFQKDQKFYFTTGVNALPALTKIVVGFLVFTNVIKLSLLSALGFYFFALYTSVLLIRALRFTGNEKPVDLLIGIRKLCSKGALGGLSQTTTLLVPSINASILKPQSFESVGIFSLSEKISSIFQLVSMSIFTVLLPDKARVLKSGKRYNLRQIFPFILIVLIAIIITIVLSEITVITIFGERYRESVQILRILAVSSGIGAVASFMDNYFYLYELTPSLLLINSIKTSVLILAGVIAVFYSGAFGMAWANLFASAIGGFLTALYIIQHERRVSDRLSLR